MQHETLFKTLGYYFRNPKLLEQALRHRSLGKHSNERLEFLGDSILNFVIADELFYRYPEMNEGDLSRLRANLVNGEVLADLAQELQIGDAIQFGNEELHGSGRRSRSILADAMEAIIGAIYLDSGFIVVQRHVLEWFNFRLDSITEIEKDPKTRLQELLQMQKRSLPVYDIIETTGAAHSKTFKVSCSTYGNNEITIGSGANKRAAERDAAIKMLHKLNENPNS
jgi:ribonuclease-3